MRGKSGIVYEHGINDMPYGWTRKNNKNRRLYNCWLHMIERVYSEKLHEKYPTYIKTTLQLELHYLSYFVEHVNEIKNYELWLNNPNDYALDKDIKSNGKNKEYSIENCMFISNSENVKQANKTRDNTQFQGENNYMYSKKHTEETRIKIFEKRKINNQKYNGQKISQYNDNMELIKIWNCANQVQNELGISASNIRKCCKFWEMNCNKEEWYKKYKCRPIKKVKGFIWKNLDG